MVLILWKGRCDIGVYIYVNSRIFVRGTKEDIEETCHIKDGWGKLAFIERDGHVYMRGEMEGLDPIKDGIVIPPDELCRYAEKNNVTLRGYVNVSCAISDYNRIGMIISRNSYHRRKRRW